MSRARQSRRLARATAARLGFADGPADVDAFVVDEEISHAHEEFDKAEALRGLDRPGAWDESAINARAAELAGCPKGFEDVYYAAYDRSARARVREILESAS